MRPKSILRVIIVFAAVAGIFLLESIRQANKLSKPMTEVTTHDDAFKVSNNDFIFFESISKYLVVSFIK